ncbi:serine/threonine-protein kinase [Luedemannella helvata]|uniref:non-specific serine/threonine protein kinase n=1 Tax=Luedemannella helvata TaxID=349315 RepID=A0ABP4WN52_9ACTN
MISPGTVLGGRYRLEERIASGGMGDVWRAVDDVLGRTVAVKVLLPALLEEPGFGERFRGEARTMATINHAGVVDIYDYSSESAVGSYLVMEYVDGDALSRTLSRVGRLTPARTMALVAQAAEALHSAHVKGVVHRDVKPGNLLVRPNGTLVLTDFGIARAVGAAQLTAAGSVLGTAAYISPEQAMGQQATPLSDIYALGIVAYQCLSGRRPFEGDNPLEIAMRHVREVPPPLPPDIPVPVRVIVERAIAKEPTARWPDAAAFASVARRAAATLAAANRQAQAGVAPGTPVHVSGGPAGTPAQVSGAQVSGGQVGAPGQPSAGQVSPGVGSPGQLPGVGQAPAVGQLPGVGQASPAAYQGRVSPGVAAVPPGGQYPASPGQPYGTMPGQPGYPVGYPQPQYPTTQPTGNRTGLVIAIIVAVVVVAICIGAAVALSKNGG